LYTQHTKAELSHNEKLSDFLVRYGTYSTVDSPAHFVSTQKRTKLL
jgi:hypothetical protein